MRDETGKKAENPYQIYYDNYLDTDACTECTGLMPTPARNFCERESYRQIFHYGRENSPSAGDRGTDIPSD